MQSCLPPYLDANVPKLSYEYPKTIHSKIFNHIKAVDEFVLDDYIKGKYSCPCHNSPYVSGHHGHIITGNLSIIPNDALRKLISKGPKYREQNKIAWGKDKKIIMDSVEKYALKWSKKDKFNVSVLDDWISEIKDIVSSKIKTLRKRIKQPPHPVLKSQEVESCLQSMHSNYVFAPADKASNNVIIICKQFYYKVLIDELGLLDTSSTSATSTYEKINQSQQTIMDKHQQFLSTFNMTVSDEHTRLPRIFAIPKLHKNPYKFRFIAGSKFCSTKQLSVLLSNGLKKVQEFWMNYCGQIEGRSGVNRFWILPNSKALLEQLNGAGVRVPYEEISSWDFSTLYTTIPHADLKRCLKSLIYKTYEKNKFQKMIITFRSAYFGNDVKDGQYAFEYDEFIELLEFLIDNIYVKFGESVFRQTIGIPMGTNCAPLLANLYLFYHEYKFFENLPKDDKRSKCFGLTFRYIDDLLSINNKYFKQCIPSIYPNELELKETTENTSECSYLDIMMFNDDGELKFKLYDKRDQFQFDIVNYPHMDSNIPIGPAYGVYVSRLIAFARVCTGFEDFKFRHSLCFINL